MPSSNFAILKSITDTIIDEASKPTLLHKVLNEFAEHCSEISHIKPDPTFDAWADDTFLQNGVAINPQAAAFCIMDYQRSVVFIRGVYSAIKTARRRFEGQSIKILYAGCGPFATLLLPLLTKFQPGELDIFFLDIHQCSLDSVKQLIQHFDLGHHTIQTLQADACDYQHDSELHLVIAETMQKSLEQEPQFAVTANLAPQLADHGIFIPERIEVELCLAYLKDEQEIFKSQNSIDQQALLESGQRHRLSTLINLVPAEASRQMHAAQYNPLSGKHELKGSRLVIPDLERINDFDALIFTRITTFGPYILNDYDAQISLPYPCHDLKPLHAGTCYEVNYQLGSYPRFNVVPVKGTR